MAAASACPNCGFKKNPQSAARCASCGAKLEGLGKVSRSREEELERRYQQEGVSVQWMLYALVVQGVLTAALVFGLPMVLRSVPGETRTKRSRARHPSGPRWPMRGDVSIPRRCRDPAGRRELSG